MAQTSYDELFSSNREKYFMSPEFKELLEELDINMERVNGNIVFSSTSKASIEILKEAIEEFDKNNEQPGKSDAYMSSKTNVIANEHKEIKSFIKDREEIEDLNALLERTTRDTQKDIDARNKLKSLDFEKTQDEIDKYEEMLEEEDREIALSMMRIKAGKAKIEKIKNEIRDKLDLIENRVITDPAEIIGINNQVAKMQVVMNELIDSINKEQKQIGIKEAKKENIRHIVDERKKAMEAAQRAIEEDRKTRERQEKEAKEVERHTKRSRFDF